MTASHDRTIFLEDIPLDAALARWSETIAEAAVPRIAERIALDDALDRVTAEPVFARLSSPHYHACAMDGIAVSARATNGALETTPKLLRVGVDAFYVDTGDPLPPGTDAVIMIEDVESLDDGTVAIRAAAPPFAHVRAIGEDVVASEAVVARGRRLGPADLAAIAGAGITEVAVVPLPRVAIITTGTELVAPDVAAPPPGAILDSNRYLLGACVRRYGGIPHVVSAIPDDPDRLAAALRDAIAAHDVVVVNAGSSAGSEDFTARTFEAHGTVLVHGVAIRPGHPVILAAAQRGTTTVPLLGIPGYPVSAAICADLFLRPLVERLAQRDPEEPPEIDVVLTRKLFSPLGETEFVRAVAARVGARLVASPLRRGAGVITSLSRANCLIAVAAASEGAPAGATIRARPLRPRAVIERTLLAVGSHDVAIDLLVGRLAARGIELVSANVGSIAGLVALANDGAHVAGTHLLDPVSETYNEAAVRHYAPGRRVALAHFARRRQGLIVARGNPLRLRSLRDVAERGARFVNRQKDAGTRVLLDVLLAREGIEADAIVGYERFEFTHTAVAALVADGSADCGIGIAAAAQALNGDFVPLADEPYELALLAEALDDPRVAALIETMREPELARAIDALPGYDAHGAGELRFVEATPAC